MLESLTTPLGPLPVWVWGVAGVLALILFKKFRGGEGLFSSALQTTPAAGAAKNEEGLDNEGNAALLDNDSWGQSTVASLISQGYDALQAQYAVGQYLDGGELDPSSASIVSAGIRSAGLPPEQVEFGNKPPTLPSPTQPKAPPAASSGKPSKTDVYTRGPGDKAVTKAPAQPAAKSQYTTYKIKSGDTLSAIAKSHGSTVKELASLNKIANPNKIAAGATIKIPK